MASGIRSATAVVSQEVPRVPVAVPEASRTQASPLATSGTPTGVGTPLAQQDVRLVSPVKVPGQRRASVGVAMVGGTAGVVMAGSVVGVGAAVGEAAGAGGIGDGEVGALASDGRTGAAPGDRAGRSAGILGGTTLIGIPRGRTPTTRITTTTGTTIRRTIRIHRIN